MSMIGERGAVALLLAVVGLLSTCNHDHPTRAECPTNPRCRIITDADADLDLADDVRRARNELLYGENAFTTGTIYLFPPPTPSGFDYEWNGEVRFCGSETMVDATPESEPICDGTDAIPTVRFKGWWSQIPLKADCGNGDDRVIDACLHFGDRLAGGGAEPPARVLVDEHLVFRYRSIISTVEQTFLKYVVAAWLDGVNTSTFRVQVHGDVTESAEIAYSGSAVLASATYSTVHVRLAPGAGAPPNLGLIADGPMSGSELIVESDFSGAPKRPNGPFQVGTSGNEDFAPIDDGCAYSADDPLGSCTDFVAYVTSKDVPSPGGQQSPVTILDGDRIVIDADIEVHTGLWNAMKLDDELATPGTVGEVEVHGNVIFGGRAGAAAIKANGVTSLAVSDLSVTTLSCQDCLRTSGDATVEEGSNYTCAQTQPSGEPCSAP
jgi:hypothetical protein